MSEAIELIKQKFYQTDTVLKEIGLQLCELHKQNQLIKARLNKLESKNTYEDRGDPSDY